MAVVAVLVVAGCSRGASTVPLTVTKVVTETGNPSGAGTGSTGAGITVVDPNATDTGTAGGPQGGTSSSPGANTATTGTTGTATTSGTTSTTSTTATTVTTGPQAAAATTALGTSCTTMLSDADISRSIGKSLPAKGLRLEDVPNPDAHMLGRIKCYYGTDTLTEPRQLVVALAAYATPEAAAQQTTVTVQSETAQGATAQTAEVSGHQAQILLRDGGLLVMPVGALTVSIAIANGVVADSALGGALQKLATAASRASGITTAACEAAGGARVSCSEGVRGPRCLRGQLSCGAAEPVSAHVSPHLQQASARQADHGCERGQPGRADAVTARHDDGRRRCAHGSPSEAGAAVDRNARVCLL
jgi:hypothetical protein